MTPAGAPAKAGTDEDLSSRIFARAGESVTVYRGEIILRHGRVTGAGSDASLAEMRARLTKDFAFESAQTLPAAPEGHKCRRMHGHSFKVEVSVEGEVDPASGWVYDHAQISAAMKPLVSQLDHAYLNEIAGLENPTIENMAGWFWEKLASQLPGLCEIVIHETTTARCVYRGGS